MKPETIDAIVQCERAMDRYEREFLEPMGRFLDGCTEEEFRAWQRGGDIPERFKRP